MSTFKKENLELNPFIIAEVGQNHQGDADIAISYVREFAQRGATAIKFQTRNNKFLFSKEAYDSSYESENAFADIYGKHRDALELNVDAIRALKFECQKHHVKFMCTPFDEPSLDLLLDIGVDVLKVASFDLGNLPLINLMAKSKLPLVLSIGGGNSGQIRSSVAQILTHHSDVAILHCVSEYPCDVDKMGLNNIGTLSNEYPDLTIGLSDHFNGTLSGPLAYMCGARVFEKHVTFNRSWKGTDHNFALEPEGFRKFVRDIRRTPLMMPEKPKAELGKEPVFKKLGKSIVLNKDMQAGEKITIGDLSGKIFNEQMIPVRHSDEIINKSLVVDKKAWEAVLWKDVE